MFVPNNRCRIQVTSGKTDVYGQPVRGRWVAEGCSIVELIIKSVRTSTRHAASGTQGSAFEEQSNVRLLLSPKTQAQIDDIVELQGHHFKIDGKQANFDMGGRLDHYEVTATIWNK